MGVSHSRLQSALFWGYQDCVYDMILAGENSVALKTAVEVLGLDWEDVDRRQIADLRLVVRYRIHGSQNVEPMQTRRQNSL